MGKMAIRAQQKLGKQNSNFDFVLLMDWQNTVGREILRVKNRVKKYKPCCSGIDCFEVGFFPCSGMVWNNATVRGLQKRLTLGIWADVPLHNVSKGTDSIYVQYILLLLFITYVHTVLFLRLSKFYHSVTLLSTDASNVQYLRDK